MHNYLFLHCTDYWWNCMALWISLNNTLCLMNMLVLVWLFNYDVAIRPVTGHDFHSYRSGSLTLIIFKKKHRKQIKINCTRWIRTQSLDHSIGWYINSITNCSTGTCYTNPCSCMYLKASLRCVGYIYMAIRLYILYGVTVSHDEADPVA